MASTQFATSRRMGIHDPLQQISMWEDAFGANFSPNPSHNIMIHEVDSRLLNKEKWHMMLNNIGSWTVIYIFGFTFLLFFICFYRSAKRRISKIKTEHNVQESLFPSPEARATRSISDKLQRRLAQNREAARKSRLRKKAYVQQLESGRIKLAQLEQELERARRQGVYGGLVSTSNVINPQIVTFEMEYDLWLEEQRKNNDELRKVLMTYTSETDLRLFVNSGFNHYYNLFRMKAIAAKADVFYLMNGLWRTPVERVFQWFGGFQPSQLLYILMLQIELMDLQLVKVTNLRQLCEQAEESLTQGMEKLQQNLAQSIKIDITSAGSYNTQMNSAMEKLEALEIFLIQADHLREETLQQLYLILTPPQAAKALLVLGEYFQRLRVLSSIWSARPRDPATLLS